MWRLGALRADQDREDEEDSALAAGLSGLRLFHQRSSAVSRPPAAPSRPGVCTSFWFESYIEDNLVQTLTS